MGFDSQSASRGVSCERHRFRTVLLAVNYNRLRARVKQSRQKCVWNNIVLVALSGGLPSTHKCMRPPTSWLSFEVLAVLLLELRQLWSVTPCSQLRSYWLRHRISNLTFRWPCVVIYSNNKTNEMHYFSASFGKELCMFRTDLLSIIRSLNTVFTAIDICHTVC